MVHPGGLDEKNRYSTWRGVVWISGIRAAGPRPGPAKHGPVRKLSNCVNWPSANFF